MYNSLPSFQYNINITSISMLKTFNIRQALWHEAGPLARGNIQLKTVWLSSFQALNASIAVIVFLGFI